MSSHSSFVDADREALAMLFANLVVSAGALAMEVLARPDIATQIKADKSPVSEADERIEAFLIKELARALPGVPVVAEEAAARGETTAHGDAFLLIDPIDGTREFLARSPDFTVNLGLALKDAPHIGAVFAPVQNRVWFAGENGFVAEAAPGGSLPPSQDWRALRARRAPRDGLTALISKSHLDDQTKSFLETVPVAERRPMGSSVKFCIVAMGDADVYPRFGRTMEWDTAAGDAVLRAAGGVTLDLVGAPLRYGKAQDGYGNSSFIAWGDPSAATQN